MPLSWQLPGGWVRYAEAPEQAAKRKIMEFLGIPFSKMKCITYTNNLFVDGFHSISLYFQLNCLNALDVNLQENKHCSDWQWVDWYDLPKPIFFPLQLLKNTGIDPFFGNNGLSD